MHRSGWCLCDIWMENNVVAGGALTIGKSSISKRIYPVECSSWHHNTPNSNMANIGKHRFPRIKHVHLWACKYDYIILATGLFLFTKSKLTLCNFDRQLSIVYTQKPINWVYDIVWRRLVYTTTKKLHFIRVASGIAFRVIIFLGALAASE